MRAKFSHILPGVLTLMLVVALSASAQDDVPGPTTGVSPAVSNLFSQDAAIYDEKPLLMEQNVKPLFDSLQHKTVPVPAAKSKANDAKKPQAEGDPLNFNFLYYILQKFKLIASSSFPQLVALYEELLEVFQFQDAFVIRFAKDHGKHAHIMHTLDIIDTANTTTCQNFDFRETVDHLLVK